MLKIEPGLAMLKASTLHCTISIALRDLSFLMWKLNLFYISINVNICISLTTVAFIFFRFLKEKIYLKKIMWHFSYLIIVSNSVRQGKKLSISSSLWADIVPLQKMTIWSFLQICNKTLRFSKNVLSQSLKSQRLSIFIDC